ncbi:PLP-dependent lyase/thiolase [Candidatus Pacearchaeota archaeon]|jgi:hypothetical protein|nr:PLP-dependent lyase/thiolase [Candidatus Pacearchaeota archaeon]
MIRLAEYTPVEVIELRGRQVHVKREDKCCDLPAPPFSKMRGLLRHMESLVDQGIRTVGYVETSVSMAGWGVAYCARYLGIRSVIFAPTFKKPLDLYLYCSDMWKQFDAEIIPIRPGMARVAYNVNRKVLFKNYNHSYMLDLGLPLVETIEETSKQWRMTMAEIRPAITVVCVGSGTVCAGILSGWSNGDGRVVGVMSRDGHIQGKQRKIETKSGRVWGGFFGSCLKLVNPGWEYSQPSAYPIPFPTHSYYDAKAWEWLATHVESMNGTVLFWNIGREVSQLELESWRTQTDK